jgi:hypothetical protein
MKIRNLRAALALLFGTSILCVAGCNSAQPAMSPGEPAHADQASDLTETRKIAEAALGKQAEVIAHGDLARNGLEQVLVVNRFAKSMGGGAVAAPSSTIFITRAAVLEKNDGKWSEVLRCDEHLKNPQGYLGGTPVERANGWRLEYTADKNLGLEMKFTPVNLDAGNPEAGTGEAAGRTVVVRWNRKAKRYQSLDRSHEGYLSEAPTLETPQSILK